MKLKYFLTALAILLLGTSAFAQFRPYCASKISIVTSLPIGTEIVVTDKDPLPGAENIHTSGIVIGYNKHNEKIWKITGKHINISADFVRKIFLPEVLKIDSLSVEETTNFQCLEELVATGMGMSICTISGKSLKLIDVSNNRLKKLTITADKELRTLKCRNNELTSLTVPYQSYNLESLDVANNRLTSLVLKDLPNLQELRLENNELSHVNFSRVAYKSKLHIPTQGSTTDPLTRGAFDSGFITPLPLQVVNVMNNKLDEGTMSALMDRPNPTRRTLMSGKTFNVGYLIKDRYSGRDYNYTPKSLITKCKQEQYTYELEKGENPSKINPNVKLYAGEEADYYSIFVTPTEHGQVLVNDIPDLDRVKMGQRVSLLVFPEEGYYLKQLMANDLDVTKSKSFILIKATTISAKFEKKTFEVKLLQPKEGGNLGIMGYNKDQLKAVPYGTELTVTVTPAAGYELKALTANGTDILATKKVVVKGATEVKATFAKKTFAVTLTKEGEGTLKATGTADLNAVPYGTELTIVATPAEGYELKALTANGADILATKKILVKGATEVKATFAKKTFAVTLTKEGEGTLTATGAADLTAVPYGTELTIEATPADGYELKALTANGTDILATQKVVVKEATEVKATFAKKTFNVTISSEVNGGVVTITGYDNLKAVPYDTELTVTVTPNEGYELAKLTANGVDILKSKKFAVRGNTTILATFVLSNELVVISESKVFPNPTKGLLHMPITDNMIVSIYSLNGIKIADRVVSGGCIDLSDLPSGQYLITTSDGYQASVTKIE